MARFSIQVNVVINPDDGRQQWIVTAERKKKKIMTFMATDPGPFDLAQELGWWFAKLCGAEVQKQGSVHYASLEHPFQEGLPF